MPPVATQPEIDGVPPAAHAMPSTPEELAQALRDADAAGQAVVPVGGATQLSLGMPPRRVDVALHTAGLNRIVEYEPADLTVTVEAGMRFKDLQAALGEQGQFLALDPAVEADATIGGIIATNASGPLRLSYGSARDLVIGTRVANADGSLTRAGGRVVKNVAGYDLNKLHIGALGTLGVIVELSFKLAPIPPAVATVVGEFGSLDGVADAVGAVLHSPLSPLGIEVLGEAKQLVFRIGGYDTAVDRQARELQAVITSHGGTAVDVPDSFWEDLSAARRRAMQRQVVVKAAVPIAQSSALVELLEQQLAPLSPVVWAHAGNGVAHAACDAPSDASVLVALRAAVQRLGSNASLVITRCPTELKQQIDVWGEPGSSVALMRAIKTKLDPHGVLNPGRYVGGI
jgi:glycolate oxidase FAD binding subunit